MQKLIQGLKIRLKSAKRIALLGVGSELRGDDAVGIMVAESLNKSCRSRTRSYRSREFKAFLGHTAPENLTGEIRAFKPTHLVIIDAAQMGKNPGEAAFIDLDDLAGVTFSTHQLPMKILADYLIQDVGCEVSVIGVEPKQLKFASSASKEIVSAARQLVKIIKEAAHV